MGIDISGVFQARTGEGWQSIKTYHQGQRGFLRWWLGYGGGHVLRHDLAVEELVKHPRGLPNDFYQSADSYVKGEGILRTVDAIGTKFQSWLDADEILDALPILGYRTSTVPRQIAIELTASSASPEQWISIGGVCKDICTGNIRWLLGSGAPRLVTAAPDEIVQRSTPTFDEAPRLIKLAPNWPPSARTADAISVDCVFVIESDEVREFSGEITELQKSHGNIRLVYGFA